MFLFKFLFILLISYSSLFSFDNNEKNMFVLVSQKELSLIVEGRVKNSYVDDIIVDDSIYPGLPVQIYKVNDVPVLTAFSALNLKNMSEKAKAIGIFECMKQNNLLSKEVEVDYIRF